MDEQALPRTRRALRRAIGLAALTSALASLGCAKSPLGWALDFAPTLGVAGKPAPNAASPAPGGTARPSAAPSGAPGSTAPGSAAPSAPAAEPTEAIGPDDPLPAPTTTSDLDPAEQAAVEQALSGEDFSAYLPAELIHDGGVALFTHDGGTSIYRTLAVGEPRRQTAPASAAPGLAPLWGRDAAEGRSGPLLALQHQPCPGEVCAAGARPVRATVRYQQKGTFAFKGAAGPVTKRFGSLFQRTIVLAPKAGGGYEPAQVSPIAVATNGGRRGLEVALVSVFREGTFSPVGAPHRTIRSSDDLATPAELPQAFGGEKVRLEVDLASRDPGAPFVFAAVQGAAPDKRVQFHDDGRGVDRTAGDGRFSGEVVLPNRSGVQHVLIDVVDPRSFSAAGPYRAFTLGVGFRVARQM